MSRDRAAYMREYRARKRRIGEVENVIHDLNSASPGRGTAWADQRIRALEEEVRHLKAELAKRPTALPEHDGTIEVDPFPDRFNTRPFTPVPKRR